MNQDKFAEITFFNRIATIFDDNMDNIEHVNILDKLGITKNISDKHILEVGCGQGEYGKILACLGGIVTGIDLSDGMITENQRRGILCGYTSMIGDVENSNMFNKNTFDSVLCIYVLHHIPIHTQTILNLYKWLKPGGYIYIYDCNGSHLIGKFVTTCHSIMEFIAPMLSDKLLIATTNERNNLNPYKLANEFRNLGFNDAVINLIIDTIFPSRTILDKIFYGINYVFNFLVKSFKIKSLCVYNRFSIVIRKPL